MLTSVNPLLLSLNFILTLILEEILLDILFKSSVSADLLWLANFIVLFGEKKKFIHSLAPTTFQATLYAREVVQAIIRDFNCNCNEKPLESLLGIEK